MLYKCNICTYESKRKDLYQKHLDTKLHINKTQDNTRHCNICDKDMVVTLENFNSHIMTCVDNKLNEYKNIISHFKEKNIEYKEKLIDSENKYKNLEIKYDNLDKEFKGYLLTNKNVIYNYINNTNNTVNSISSYNYVNKYFDTAPELAKITDYNLYDKTQNVFYIRELIFYYKEKTLPKFIGDHIIKLYKKENPKEQSVRNTDTTRLSYIVRIISNKILEWKIDKDGNEFKKITVDPLLDYINNDIIESRKMINQKIKEHDSPYCDYNELSRLLSDSHILYDINKEIEIGKLCNDILKYVSPNFYLNKTTNIETDITYDNNIIIEDISNQTNSNITNTGIYKKSIQKSLKRKYIKKK